MNPPGQKSPMRRDPFHASDDHARSLARRLLGSCRHAILATQDAETGFPLVTRIALQTEKHGVPIALLSDLARHSQALRVDNRAGLLIGDASPDTDPMRAPRLSIQGRATIMPLTPAVRAAWLERDPWARAYIDLPDFRLWRIDPVHGLLNAGFGRAYRMEAADMLLPPTA